MEERRHPKEMKTVAASRTETARSVFYKDINGFDRLFGGRLMEWIDETAGIAAKRHCGTMITTACVDQLQFRHAAHLDDVVVIKAQVTYVGTTSCEVRCDSYVEDMGTGEHNLINTAYLTEVSIDSEGRPQPIAYGLVLMTQEERDEWEAAHKRKELRRQRKEQGF